MKCQTHNVDECALCFPPQPVIDDDGSVSWEQSTVEVIPPNHDD